MKTKLITVALLAVGALFAGTPDSISRPPLHIWMDEPPDQTWTVEGQYPEVPGSERALIFEANDASGGYNHHAKIAYTYGKFHAMWSNQRYDEDGPGQRVLYASSDDGLKWSAPRELVPALSPESPWGRPGVFCQAGDFIEWNGRLFAGAGATEIVGWNSQDKTRSSPVYTKECPWPVYAPRGAVVREIKSDGTFGTLFSRLHNVDPAILLKPVPPQKEIEPGFVFPPCEWNLSHAFSQMPERRLCEPAVWKTPEGRYIGLFRDDSSSGFKWLSESQDGKTWTKPSITDMHDAPSLTFPLTLDNGTVLLFGNHRGRGKTMPGVGWRDRDPLMVSITRDGIHFSDTHAVREGFYTFKVTGPRCRGGSAQYPCAIVKDGYCHIIYSLGKESIETTRFPLKNLLKELK